MYVGLQRGGGGGASVILILVMGPRTNKEIFKSHRHFPECDVIRKENGAGGGLVILNFGVGCANPELRHEKCQ